MTATMTNVLSPKSYGSILYAVLVHVAIYGIVVVMMGLNLGSTPAPGNDYVDMSYQTFDEPPAPAEKPQQVRRSAEPETKVQPLAVPDNAPKEMQDEKSDIAGTQKAKAETNIGNDSNGTAATTPFYKIRPKYPKAALLAGVEGWVMLMIDINEQGEVENIRISGGEQREMFGSEARRAVAQWKFRPFLDASGHPTRKADHAVRVDFRLRDEEAGS